MKKYLFMLAIAVTSLFIGISNVRANDSIVFKTINAVPITVFDLGSVTYDTSKWESFRIYNNAGEELTISSAVFESDQFEVTLNNGNTIPKDGFVSIQVNNVKGIDVTGLYITSNLVVTLSDGSEYKLPVKFIVEKASYTGPSFLDHGYAGDEISSINLTRGWVWNNPAQLITEGKNNYEIKYVDQTGNYNDEIRNVEIEGIIGHDVVFNLDEHSWTLSQRQFRILSGYSTTFTIYAKSGCYLTSVKFNDVEQLTDNVKEFEMTIDSVDSDITIDVESERTVIESVKDPETNEVIVPKFEIDSSDDVKIKFDYDFSEVDGRVNDVYINGKYIEYSLINKYFKFTEGSVIVSVTNEYLKSLDAGTYDIDVELLSGEILRGSFVVEEANVETTPEETTPEETTPEETVPEDDNVNPDTGDNIIIYIGIAIISLIGIIGIIYNKNKQSV